MQVVKAKYGNLFQMYEKITDDNPYETPMKIFCGTLYYGRHLVDYNLMTTVPGLYACGEANFGPRSKQIRSFCLDARISRWLLALPYTIGDYLANDILTGEIPIDLPEFEVAEKVTERLNKLINIKGSKP